MSDQQLLIDAARAVNRGKWHILTHTTKNGVWDSLNDDSEAFLLSVFLDMNVFHANKTAYAMDAAGDFEAKVEHGDDKFAATRRAIVKCAALMGEE